MSVPLLDAVSLRVLGCLVEKAMATPEYYPLTLNSLLLACNQKSNRDPVVSFEEATVQAAVEALCPAGLARRISQANSRVLKFGHRLDEALKLEAPALAILCELLLRGPQTPGELRARASRLQPFADLAEVEAVLAELEGGEEPLLMALPRQPGRKEIRHAHLLGGPPALDAEPAAGATEAPATPFADLHTRVARLEAEVAELRAALADLLPPSP